MRAAFFCAPLPPRGLIALTPAPSYNRPVIHIRSMLAGLILLGVVVGAGAYNPTVTTDLGIIRGTHDRHDTVIWRGIPYAQPPVGDLRWRAPRAVEA
jgi:carboxylesterase family protein